jgi:hypothetical protein
VRSLSTLTLAATVSRREETLRPGGIKWRYSSQMRARSILPRKHQTRRYRGPIPALEAPRRSALAFQSRERGIRYQYDSPPQRRRLGIHAWRLNLLPAVPATFAISVFVSLQMHTTWAAWAPAKAGSETLPIGGCRIRARGYRETAPNVEERHSTGRCEIYRLDQRYRATQAVEGLGPLSSAEWRCGDFSSGRAPQAQLGIVTFRSRWLFRKEDHLFCLKDGVAPSLPAASPSRRLKIHTARLTRFDGRCLGAADERVTPA